MAGTKTGGLKARNKNLATDPDFYKKIGATGGKNGHTGGFYQNRELAKKAGSKGGKLGHRGPAKPYPGEIKVAYSAGTTAIPFTITHTTWLQRLMRRFR